MPKFLKCLNLKIINNKIAPNIHLIQNKVLRILIFTNPYNKYGVEINFINSSPSISWGINSI